MADDTHDLSNDMGGLDRLLDVAVEVRVELGRRRMTLGELMDCDVGSIIELDTAAGARVTVCANDVRIAEGEVIVVGERYGVRIRKIVEPAERTGRKGF